MSGRILICPIDLICLGRQDPNQLNDKAIKQIRQIIITLINLMGLIALMCVDPDAPNRLKQLDKL